MVLLCVVGGKQRSPRHADLQLSVKNSLVFKATLREHGWPHVAADYAPQRRGQLSRYVRVVSMTILQSSYLVPPACLLFSMISNPPT